MPNLKLKIVPNICTIYCNRKWLSLKKYICINNYIFRRNTFSIQTRKSCVRKKKRVLLVFFQVLLWRWVWRLIRHQKTAQQCLILQGRVFPFYHNANINKEIQSCTVVKVGPLVGHLQPSSINKVVLFHWTSWLLFTQIDGFGLLVGFVNINKNTEHIQPYLLKSQCSLNNPQISQVFMTFRLIHGDLVSKLKIIFKGAIRTPLAPAEAGFVGAKGVTRFGLTDDRKYKQM